VNDVPDLFCLKKKFQRIKNTPDYFVAMSVTKEKKFYNENIRWIASTGVSTHYGTTSFARWTLTRD
jgi:hypothetical protein